jgi:hypothetical protein
MDLSERRETSKQTPPCTRSTIKHQHSLTTFGIRHAIDANSQTRLHVGHVQRGDQDVLLLFGRVGGIDLRELAKSHRKREKKREQTISLMLVSRLTASMNTSNSSVEWRQAIRAGNGTTSWTHPDI